MTEPELEKFSGDWTNPPTEPKPEVKIGREAKASLNQVFELVNWLRDQKANFAEGTPGCVRTSLLVLDKTGQPSESMNLTIFGVKTHSRMERDESSATNSIELDPNTELATKVWILRGTEFGIVYRPGHKPERLNGSAETPANADLKPALQTWTQIHKAMNDVVGAMHDGRVQAFEAKHHIPFKLELG